MDFTGLKAELFLSVLIGYAIGSIPSAYLLTKWSHGLDLRTEGSRNIGSLNSYEVTGSRRVGLLTLIADVTKGLLPVTLTALLADHAVPGMAVGLIVGHCYPLWLRFHGGRGLATAAGICLGMNPILLAGWLGFFFIGYAAKRHVHFGAIVATLGSAIFVGLIPEESLVWGTMPWLEISLEALRITTWLMLFVIFTRHISPLRDLLRGAPQ